MVGYIDIHSHLEFLDAQNKLMDAMNNARQAEVSDVLSCGTHPQANRATLEIAKQYKEVKACLGWYPPDAQEIPFTEEAIDEEIEFIRQNAEHIVAIGEVGMDFKDGKDKEMQERVFRKFIQLAKALDKPIVIHSRKAEEDVLRILQEEEAKKVLMHCFCGKKKLIKLGMELGYYFSVPTAVVRAENFQMLVDIVPLSQLFCETDAPFLSPFKDKKNEPAFVVESYKKIAEIKKMDLEEVKNIIYANYQKLFW